MTSGQYKLEISGGKGGKGTSGLDLAIIDHNSKNGGNRDIKSLSGGELFKASLSLALGTAEIISENAGGIRRDPMFIDEGFGSLDEKSLPEVIGLLKRLSTERGRSIGIISHVHALQEGISKQIVVKKGRNGSVLDVID